MRGRKKRTYHYGPTTLTLSKLIEIIDSGQDIIDLTPYSNGGSWFWSLSTVFPPILPDTGSPSPCASEKR
jgi:hypothetical protein